MNRSSSTARTRSARARSGTCATGDRLDSVAECERVRSRGVAGDTLDERHRLGDRPALEQLLDALVGEEQLALERDDPLAGDVEPEMPRLDDAGVNRPDRDLEDSFALDASHRVRLIRVREPSVPRKVLPQRMRARRDVLVVYQTPAVRVAFRPDAEHVLGVPLVPVGSHDLPCQRFVPWRIRGEVGRDLQPLVRPVEREDRVHAESPALRTIVGGKQEVERQTGLRVQVGRHFGEVGARHRGRDAAVRRRRQVVVQSGDRAQQLPGAHGKTVKSRAILAAHS